MHSDRRGRGCVCGSEGVVSAWVVWWAGLGTPRGESRRAGDAGWPAADSRPPEQSELRRGLWRSAAGLIPEIAQRGEIEMDGGSE